MVAAWCKISLEHSVPSINDVRTGSNAPDRNSKVRVNGAKCVEIPSEKVQML